MTIRGEYNMATTGTRDNIPRLPGSRSDLDGLSGLSLALFWAGLGHRVMPVWHNTKRPWIKAWQDEASTDPEKIRGWWRSYPNARVGLATGAPGCDVVDIDVAGGKPGLAQLEKLMDAGVLLPRTFMVVSTPSGGRHLFFLGSEQRNRQNEKAIPGVDFRGVGGQVLAPGNPDYRIVSMPLADLAPVDWSALAACLAPVASPAALPASPVTQQPLPGMAAPSPPAVVAAGLSGAKPSRLVAPVRAFDNAPGEESALDWYCAHHDLGRLLVDDGWTFAYNSDGRDYYRRPGKEDHGVSGNVMTHPDGRQTFVNFSTSVDLPTDRGMSVAQWYAHRHHGGDMKAAASQIRRTMMPQRTHPGTAAGGHGTNQEQGTGMATGLGQDEATEGTGEANLPVVPTELPEMVRQFWTKRDVLRRIAHLARERKASPWATLGAVLAITSCRIGPHVVLPPTVGGVASLNLLVGLVGGSSVGKGAASNAAREFMGMDDGRFFYAKLGTGQGIDSAFTEQTKAGPVQFNDVALFEVPEVDTLAAHSQQAGSTLLATLREAYMAEPLGAHYANKDKRRPVRAHGYRTAVLCGIQPARSGVLLNDADGGTPQRWLWLPTNDPDRYKGKLAAPLYVDQPPQVEFDTWVPAGETYDDDGKPVKVEVKQRYEIPICGSARDATLALREAALDRDLAGSGGGNLDGHSNLTRLKVAALLAFLDRRHEMTEEDWELSGWVMWVSNATRAVCQRAMQEVDQAANRKRGEGRAHAALAEDAARAVLLSERQVRVADLAEKAAHALRDGKDGKDGWGGGDWVSPRLLNKELGDNKTVTQYGAAVYAALRTLPGVEEGPEESRGGKTIRRWRWVGAA
jgi:hypothetical protein